MNLFILGVSRKKIFWGYEEFVDILMFFCSQNWAILGGHFYTFCDFFLKVKVLNRNVAIGLLQFHFISMAEIPDNFMG